MTTRKELIEEQYTLLKEEIENTFGNNLQHLLPPLQEINITDILYYFVYIFDITNIKFSIKVMLNFKSIQLDDTDIDKLCEILLPFVQFIKTLE